MKRTFFPAKFAEGYILLLLLVLHPLMILAQNNAVEWSVFDAGFGIPASSTTTVKSAVGQSFNGSSQVANTFIESGFLVNPLLRGSLVGVSQAPDLPLAFSLSQNYPNPFNPATKVRYELPKGSYVTITLYNVIGQEVATLVNEEQQPGRYEVSWNASGFASGVYFYRIQTKEFVATKKLMLLR